MLHNLLEYSLDSVPESIEITLSMLHVFRGFVFIERRLIHRIRILDNSVWIQIVVHLQEWFRSFPEMLFFGRAGRRDANITSEIARKGSLKENRETAGNGRWEEPREMSEMKKKPSEKIIKADIWLAVNLTPISQINLSIYSPKVYVRRKESRTFQSFWWNLLW